ncbi:MAG TPA: hypothetical protein VNL16_03110 [Chloroflexota bacterium]|nr:hypothetical protein [Chloroflexota bacterium]
MANPVGKPIAMKIAADRLEEPPEVSELVDRLEAEADRDIAAGTVTLRWGKEQIAVVKRAATLLGVPYQTYLKHVVFKQALADIEHAEAVLGRRT